MNVSFRFAALVVLSWSVACGGAPPSKVVAATPPVAKASEPPPDVTAVPEPAGLLLVARISKPEAILKTVSSWSHFPLPAGADLLRSIGDDGIADVVDFTKPVDAAIALADSKRMKKPHAAVSVAVRSFDEAKAKLSTRHTLIAGDHGQLFVQDLGRSTPDAHDESDEPVNKAGAACVLAHAPAGARLVCGERPALDALAPYLARTLPRKAWTADIHMEITPAPIREWLEEARSGMPMLGRALLGGTGSATGQIFEAVMTELFDITKDMNRLTVNAELLDSGIEATVAADYGSATSLVARLSTSRPERTEAPPSAFLHLPAETDYASYAESVDPKVFDHVRELFGNATLELAQEAGMPEQERRTLRELLIDRMFPLVTGPMIWGKGYDFAAVERAVGARKAAPPDDLAATLEAESRIQEHAFGWHLVRVSEPIAKVGPILKDWSALWHRRAFTKWATPKSTGKMAVQLKIAPPPAGATLPKDTVHLEILVAHADREDWSKKGAKPSKKVRVKPTAFHVLAVPDQGATWLAIGVDGKQLVQKAAASLSTAPTGATLGTTPSAVALRSVRANGASFFTLRGVLGMAALSASRRDSPFEKLGALPNKGLAPIIMTYTSKGPSDAAKAGTAFGTLTVSRAVIEDVAKLALTSITD